MAAIVIGGWTTMTAFRADKAVTALVVLAGSILVFTFFGLRWFGDSAKPGTTGTWPPVINTCPDFLTFYERTVAGSKVPTCIDTIGVSKKNTLQRWPAEVGAEAPAGDNYYFSLSMPAGVTKKDSIRAELCKRVIDAGLTWEGITDGQTCFGVSDEALAAATAGAAACQTAA